LWRGPERPERPERALLPATVHHCLLGARLKRPARRRSAESQPNPARRAPSPPMAADGERASRRPRWHSGWPSA